MRMPVIVAFTFAVAPAAIAQVVVGGQQQTIQLPPAPPPLQGGLQIPPRDNAQQKTGTAKLKGRIVNMDTGAPLRRAQVRINAAEIRESRAGSTDAEGRYEFNDLPAGRWMMNVSKAGYVSLGYGQRRPNEQGKPIELAEGQVLEKVDMSLPRGSAVTGRILDEFGEPVAGVNVQAMRYRFQNGQRRLVPAGGSQGTTDDLGNYRVYGLAPGDYAISASMRGGGIVMMANNEGADRSAYAPTYYPGTQQTAEAQRLTINVGQELSNISFALIPSRAARISGSAMDSTGRPLGGESISLRQEFVTPASGGGGTSVMMFSNTGASIRPDGTFTLNNVAPGDYFLDVRTRNAAEPESASVAVSVVGDDINGVSIVTTKGATIRGQIVFEGGIPGTIKPDAVQINQVSLDPSRSISGGGAVPRTNDDWTFEIKGLAPGLRTFRPSRAPASWVVKSVMLNGDDIIDKGYEFKGTEEINGLQVILTSQISEAVGTVTDEKLNTSREYTAVVFSVDREKWTLAQTRYTKIARPDQEGRFRIRGLPAGEYYVAAVDFLEPGEEGDPELLDQFKAFAQKFAIGEGETKPLALKIHASS